MKQIDMWGIEMVFVVGGNGGNAGANAIQQECEKQNVVASIVGIPKSIDNDILLVRDVPPILTSGTASSIVARRQKAARWPCRRGAAQPFQLHLKLAGCGASISSWQVWEQSAGTDA